MYDNVTMPFARKYLMSVARLDDLFTKSKLSIIDLPFTKDPIIKAGGVLIFDDVMKDVVPITKIEKNDLT